MKGKGKEEGDRKQERQKGEKDKRRGGERKSREKVRGEKG